MGLSEGNKEPSKKDKAKSEAFRAHGNTLYQKKKDEEALQLYYKALDCAPVDDLCYHRAMCNIAVVLHRLDFPKFALDHFKRVAKNFDKLGKTPDQRKNILDKMKICEKGSNVSLYQPPTQKLYRGPNKFYPQLSSAARVAYSADRGRHLIAAEDIPVGSVVIVEKPSVICTHETVLHCSHCAHLLPLSYLPCPWCDARFCNEECLDRGIHGFHLTVCNEDRSLRSPLRDLPAAALLHYTLQEIRTTPAKQRRSDVEVRFDNTSFASLMLLQSHDIPPGDVEDVKSRLKLVKRVFETRYVRGKEIILPNDDAILERALVELAKRVGCNAHLVYRDPCESVFTDDLPSLMLECADIGIERTFYSRCSSLLSDTGLQSSNDFAVCFLPVVSIANHSCVPNLTTSFTDRDDCCMVVRTSRDILEGEELLHNYGPIIGIDSYSTRQISLAEDYHFVCRCEACRLEGKHPIDYRMSCKICCFCEIEFVPPPNMREVKVYCDKCHDDKEVQDYIKEVIDDDPYLRTSSVLTTAEAIMSAALNGEEKFWSRKKAQEEAHAAFKKLLNMYYIGNYELEKFVAEACLEAVRARRFDYAEEYVQYLSEHRKLVACGRVSAGYTNAFFLPAILDLIQMKYDPAKRTKSRMRNFKKNWCQARTLFQRIYGPHSLKELEMKSLMSFALELCPPTPPEGNTKA